MTDLERKDRILAIVIALQHELHTAQALATKLEVSKRTIMRDIQVLCEMGVPIDPYSSEIVSPRCWKTK
ncbi:MAG: HTH domain-containing protein [Clostridia bacterium]